ncbi:Pkinase-domain-containing protein [Basidiobolus meristosporus CBS 931.73]|uniref:Pkinase-domain-containing protein n=1 Tax=Basidiobolus meristosporus CBS 931.73 TaxID=1314790 RepID=A0A1Y1YNB7_9FUNG|nr:Pkinase-domain-containing protein [Basidiobolus meristosporus CBS 931.73]|eukprot:ORX99509.1 Pkinase-domain-containing protein [Basidiobolus meristosporus CBS 931.73]
MDDCWGILQSLNSTQQTIYLSRTDGKGYLLGRHPECDVTIDHPQVSNRHCLIFKENKVDTQAGPQEFSGDHVQLTSSSSKSGAAIEDHSFIFKQLALHKEHQSALHEKYLIGGTLGQGNFAEVKLATERSTGKKFAVKIINKLRFRQKSKLNEALQREIAILMAIKHPCIISTHGVYDEQDFLYIVLELVDGGELFDLIEQKQRFSEPETRLVFYQLFQAIKYLHDRGITHRDMKPENILLDSKSPLRVKVSDFGLAKIVGEASFTQTLCGTPNYVAPEVLQLPQHRQYSKGVDLWSLGVILYICLCGFPPFADELGPPSMQAQIKEGIYNFPSPYWDNVSAEAIDLVKRLLQVNPQERLTVDEALEHPWMKIEDRVQEDASISSYFDTLKHEFSRVHTTLSSETPEVCKREPMADSSHASLKRPRMQ